MPARQKTTAPKAAQKPPKKSSKATSAKAVTKKSVAKSSLKKPVKQPAETTKRQLKRSPYKSFQLSRRIKHPGKLPSAWKLAVASIKMIWQNKKLFLGIALIYGLLNLVLVRGFSSGVDVASSKDILNEVFKGNWGQLTSGLAIFAVMVTASGNSSSDAASVYQLFLLLTTSLAVIWALRQSYSGVSVRIRDAFYRGMSPLVLYILVFLVVGLQLLPMIIGSSLYNLVVSNGIAAGALERTAWLLLFLSLTLLSLYMITSSIFATYIVTLPDMTPFKALRSARQLVKYRRWTVLRKIILMPIFLFLAGAIIMLPIILFATPLAQWVFFILTMVGLVLIHAYMYNLYRELL
jgi:hypothetical protein